MSEFEDLILRTTTQEPEQLKPKRLVTVTLTSLFRESHTKGAIHQSKSTTQVPEMTPILTDPPQAESNPPRQHQQLGTIESPLFVLG